MHHFIGFCSALVNQVPVDHQSIKRQVINRAATYQSSPSNQSIRFQSLDRVSIKYDLSVGLVYTALSVGADAVSRPDRWPVIKVAVEFGDVVWDAFM